MTSFLRKIMSLFSDPEQQQTSSVDEDLLLPHHRWQNILLPSPAHAELLSEGGLLILSEDKAQSLNPPENSFLISISSPSHDVC